MAPPVRQLVRVAEQGQQPVAQEVRRGLETGGEQEDGGEATSSSVSWSSFSRASTSELSRSSRGWRRLSSSRRCEVLAQERAHGLDGRPVSSSLSIGSMPLAAARTRAVGRPGRWRGRPPAHRPPRWAAGRAKSAMNSTSPRASTVSSRPATSRARRAEPLDLARGERPGPVGATGCGPVGRPSACCAVTFEEFAAAGPASLKCPSTCPRRLCHARAAGRATRPGTRRSR